MNDVEIPSDDESAPPDGPTRIVAAAEETRARPADTGEQPVNSPQYAVTQSQSEMAALDEELGGVPKIINNRYALKRLLGQGGYATVYEGWDGVLCRSVAIKIPRAERFRSKRILDEFLTEARTAARLKHKSIVAMHDVGWTPDGTCFIVLDYLGEATLSEALVRQPYSTDDDATL